MIIFVDFFAMTPSTDKVFSIFTKDWEGSLRSQSTKSINSLLMNFEWRMSLWTQIFGVGGLASSFGASAWVASATSWIAAYGPIGWLSSGIFGSLFFLIGFYIFHAAREKMTATRLNEARAQSSTNINILEDNFHLQVINIHDIFDTMHRVIKHKQFRRCRFSGPISMAFLGNCTISSSEFVQCNFVIVEDNDQLQGLSAFSDSLFQLCQFDLVTIFLNRHMASNIKKDMPNATFVGAKLDYSVLQENS